MNKKILVIGSANIDLVTYTDIMPNNGETVVGTSFMTNIGGKGLNQAFASFYLGADVTFFGSLGKDSNGNIIKEFCEKEGLNCIFKECNTSTGVASIVINNKTGENRIIVVAGSNNEIAKEDIDIELIKQNDIILLQNEIPIDVVEYIIKLANSFNKIIVLNPAPYKRINKDIYALIDYVIPNEHELEMICENKELKKGIEELLKLGVKNVVVTLGEKGSILVNDVDEIKMEAINVNAIDTTGAGDSFVGAFVTALSFGKNKKEAMTFATLASSISVTRCGAIKSMPKIDEIKF